MEKNYTAKDLYVAFVVGKIFATKPLPASKAQSYWNAVRDGLKEAANDKEVDDFEQNFNDAINAMGSHQ